MPEAFLARFPVPVEVSSADNDRPPTDSECLQCAKETYGAQSNRKATNKLRSTTRGLMIRGTPLPLPLDHLQNESDVNLTVLGKITSFENAAFKICDRLCQW